MIPSGNTSWEKALPAVTWLRSYRLRDRLRHEGVDNKLGGVNRFTTVADVIEYFQRERNASPLQPNEPHPTE